MSESRRHAAGVRRWLLAFLVSSLALAGVVLSSWAQSSPVVVGAESLFVRRGPGTEFPPFATLTKGDTVEVLEMRGEWARIQTANGQSGYVRSTFLIAPGQREKEKPAATPPAAAPTVAPQSKAAAAAEHVATAEVRAANERNKALEAEVRTLQQQLAELKSHAEATPPAVTPASRPTVGEVSAADELRTDVAQLTLAVNELQRRLDAQPGDAGVASAAVPDDAAGHGWSSSGLVLGVIGLMLGWLIGGTMGRRPDRGRRTRIRF